MERPRRAVGEDPRPVPRPRAVGGRRLRGGRGRRGGRRAGRAAAGHARAPHPVPDRRGGRCRVRTGEGRQRPRAVPIPVPRPGTLRGAGGSGNDDRHVDGRATADSHMRLIGGRPRGGRVVPLVNGSVRARAAHANRDVRVEGAGLARRSVAVRQTRGRVLSGSRPGGLPWATFRILRLLNLL